MSAQTYAECLDRAYKVNWKIRDVLGFADFDRDRPWLPEALSAGPALDCLAPAEKLKLTHVEMGAYAHLFAFVEAFIAPQMVALARDSAFSDNAAFEALTHFASEEVKHIHLFQEIRGRVDEKLGFRLELMSNQLEVAGAVLGCSRGGVLLLTSAIEWLTQHHFLSAMRDSDSLDPLTKEIFRFHWMEEAQHARLDHLEAVRVFRGMTAVERGEALDDFVQLLGALDDLLQTQAGLDLTNLRRYLGRGFDDAEAAAIKAALLAAKRHCFIATGIAHPGFQELFQLVATPAQQETVRMAVASLVRAAA